MLIPKETIQDAKEKLGDGNADLIAQILELKEYDQKNMRSLCPFHEEKTPSFIYDTKRHCFHCFGKCGINVDAVTAYMHTGMTYVEACKEFFEQAKVKFAFGEHKVKTKKQYKYPVGVPINDKKIIYKYLGLRQISKETIDYCDVREDKHGNVVFNFYDSNDTLTLVKYRPSHAIDKTKGEIKCWCEKDADTANILFNMNRINISEPLLITEGECFPGYTEVLTKDGWLRLDEYDGQEVMQINDSLNGDFVRPLAYIKKEYSGDILSYNAGGNYEQATTPGHNLVYTNKKTLELCKKKAEDFYTSANMSGSRFQTTCMYDGDGLELSNAMIALYLAVSADGSIRNRKKWSDENYCDISFKKERKKNRLSAILKDLSIPYSRNDNIAAEGYSSFAFRIPKWFKKEIPIEFATKSSIEQKKFILDELVYWDGNRVNGRTQTEYSSKLIHNVTVIQLIAHTCGMMSTIMHRKNQFGEWYQLSILNKSYVTYQKTKGMITSHLDGFVYCVTVPTGMIMVRQNNKISITGNCDQLASVESGYKNAVSVPLGANNYGWIEENWEWLEQFDSIILAFDNDEAGRKAQKECIYRLGSWKTKIMDIPENVTLLDGTDVKVKDINEMLYYFGKEAVLAAILNAKDSPVDSLVDYSDIHEVDLSEIDGIETGIQELDKEIMRLFYGTFNILTGINGSGKSSFLSQLVAQSIDQNKDVWMYSKELPNYMLKNWQTYIFAGRRHISEYMAQNGSVYYKVNDGVKRAIDDYYRGHLKIYKDGYKNSIQSIKTSMEDSARKFGSKLFIIDNLTAMNFECNDNEKWSKQVDFINWSIDFAQKYHVVVMLVIHPKKIEAMRRLTKLDVQGLGSIVDLAHRLISLYRVSPKEKMGVMKQAGGGWLTKPVEFDVLLDVLKDRMRGREGLAVGLHYDTPSRRFYTNENEFRHQYRWDKTKYEDEIPYPKVNEPEIFGNKELL